MKNGYTKLKRQRLFYIKYTKTKLKTAKEKEIIEVISCCSKCKSIKPINYVPNCKCSNFDCKGNRKFLTFYFIGSKRKYVSNNKVRYRQIEDRDRYDRTVKI